MVKDDFHFVRAAAHTVSARHVDMENAFDHFDHLRLKLWVIQKHRLVVSFRPWGLTWASYIQY